MNKLNLIVSEDFVKRVPIDNAYQYSPTGKYLRLQKVLFWLLEKLDCQYVERQFMATSIRIELDSLVDYLFESIREMEGRQGLRPSAVLMGARQFNEAMGEGIEQYLEFQFPLDFKAKVHPDYLQARFMGLSVFVLPWFDGVVVIPESVMEA